MDQQTSEELELFQFAFSPYCEKVRWLLDLKGLVARERYFLPGMQPRFMGFYDGECMTPTLKVGQQHLQPTSVIQEFIEVYQPFPALSPADDSDQAAARELQARFDREWGPKLHKLMLAKLLETPDYAAQFWSKGHSTSEKRLYINSFAMARKALEQDYGLAAKRVLTAGERALKEALDLVAERTAKDGFMVAGRLSTADLTAASFLAPFARPAGCALTCPDPAPESLAAWLAGYEDHPAIVWTRGLYAQWRGRADGDGGARRIARLSTRPS